MLVKNHMFALLDITQEWILYKDLQDMLLHLNCVTTLPDKTKNSTETVDRFLLCFRPPG